MTHRLLLSMFLAGASMSACAQSTLPPGEQAKAAESAKATPAATQAGPKVAPGSAAARALAGLQKINAAIVPDSVSDAPIPGFQQAIVGGQVLYVSNDGKYLMQGTLYDINAQKNLAEVALSGVRRELLQQIPSSERIVFAPANPKHTVTVFTDVGCGYCRKMHSEIADYNKQGIAVEYVAFPRMGPASEDFRKMEAVWCAKDPRKALTDAKSDRKVATVACKNPVARHHALGQRAGLTGTPMILAEDGTQLGGYLPAAELRAALDKHAAQQTKGKPPGANGGA